MTSMWACQAKLVNAKLVATNLMRLPASERRQAIIKEAIRLFSEKGFRGTTTRELASAVGVSEPVIYQHFATKKDLYAAIIESKAKEVHDQLEFWAEARAGDDRTAFLALGRLIWRWYEADREQTRLLFFSALEGHELSDLFFTRHAAGFLEAVSSHIRGRIKAGVFRAIDPETQAQSFIGMVAHHAQAVHVFRFDPKPRPREDVLEDMVDIFLRGVLREHGKIQTKLASSGSARRAVDGRGGVRKKG